MLIQFNFKNFKSFREEATLDLSAAKMTEFSNRVVEAKRKSLRSLDRLRSYLIPYLPMRNPVLRYISHYPVTNQREAITTVFVSIRKV